MKRTLYPLFLLAVLAAPRLQAQAGAMPQVPVINGLPPAAHEATASIDPNRIRAHVRFLASDLLEGRGPGARGAQLAAEYIATQFALAGAQPAGEHGSWFQTVPLIAVHTDVDATKFSLLPKNGQAIPLQYGRDVVTKDETGQSTADVNAPIVFVGYGIHAPEYHWDDYAGVDVKGKVLLVIVNEPPSNDERFFKGKALTYYGRWIYKYEEAARRGAIGVLIIHRDDLASYGWDVVRNSQSVEKSFLADDPLATLRAASWIQLDVAQKLFASAGMDVAQQIQAAGKPGFKPVELPATLQAHISSQVRKYQSANVIAKVRGANPTPGGDVLYTAHYDHLGIDPALPGDKIYNGAADNATGCGILLEIARAFASLKTPPPRTVYLAAVTAEEQGLLGSEYLGMHPPEPLRNLAIDLNFDELLPLGVPLSVKVAGAQRTNFYPVVESTAAAFHLQIQPDDAPMAGHYYRSDHFSLARFGVPAFSVDEGNLFASHPPEWGKQKKEEYDKERYHQPTDEFREDMDFRSDAELAQFGFVLGWQAMSSPIAWKPGDEFESARKHSMRSEQAVP